MPESGKLTVGAKVEKSDGIMAPMLLPVRRIDHLSDL